MSRSQQYIVSLFDHLPKTSLPNTSQQTFDQIKNKIESSPDVVEELKTLYKVNNMSDVALSLLWIAEKVENDPSRLDPTTDEEALVFSMLQNALASGEINQAPSFSFETPPEPTPSPEISAESPPEPAAFDFPSAGAESETVSAFDDVPTAAETAAAESPQSESNSAFDVFNAPPQEEAPITTDFGTPASEVVPEPVPAPETLATPEPSMEAPPQPEPVVSTEPPPLEADIVLTSDASPAVAAGDEVQHAALFEKFIEALQGGADDRMALFDQLVQVSTAAATGAGGDDYKEYSQLLIDLLKSLNDNQMLDDIRAMNMLSTAFDPFSQWAKADAAGREGLLFQGIETLKGFKALFE
ncbi:MAG: hypothetical protein HYY49_01510 [Ignavibacteriales bacterium]|nr:hypothetical protein [Ignavibacteriales bacterium]